MQEKNSFSEKALAVIDQSIREINFGEIILIVQDGHIVQIERTERIMISSRTKVQRDKKPEEVNRLRNEILSGLTDLQYGQVVVKIKDGKAVQIEKTEKRRFPELEGIYGDGI